MGYDEYGQRSRVRLGNGTETRYERDPLMQRLRDVTTDGSTVNFFDGGAGERTHKYSSAGVSVYANAYWSVRNGVQTTKHLFASGQRIASVVNDPATGAQERWFHTDHLGSTQFVTDAAGSVREHHESFPFGEPWIEESSASDTTPYRFTGKELVLLPDLETGEVGCFSLACFLEVSVLVPTK